MSVITGQRFGSQASQSITGTVSNDGFWPDIDLALLNESLRLSGDVTEKRLLTATKRAIRSVNNDLAKWKKARKLEGYVKLNDVPVDKDDPADLLIEHYLDAVHNDADASLCKRYRNTDTTAAGDKRADMIDPHIAEAYRDKHLAIKAILDYQVRTHLTITVELI